MAGDVDLGVGCYWVMQVPEEAGTLNSQEFNYQLSLWTHKDVGGFPNDTVHWNPITPAADSWVAKDVQLGECNLPFSSLTFREEQKFRVFENKVLKKIFGPPVWYSG